MHKTPTAILAIRRAARRTFERLSGPSPLVPIDDRPLRDDIPPVVMDWPEATPKPLVGLVKDRDRPPYWTKYQRFLEHNNIPFDYYSPHNSHWLDDARPFDAIVWRVESPPTQVEEARRKIYLLEHHANKLCYPRFFSAQIYEDKIMQWELLRSLGYPAISTFYSASYNETMNFFEAATYPLVSKVATGSGSVGVTKVRNASVGKAMMKRVFSLNGLPTYWPHVRQHGYALLQPLELNAGYDLRILVIGQRVFGYYRDVPKGDFRASGHSATRKEELPADAINLAREIAQELDHEMLAVDFLRRPDGSLGILEMSAFVRVYTPRQLEVDGVAGAYEFDERGTYVFRPGEVWPQELALAEFFERRWIRARRDHGGG